MAGTLEPLKQAEFRRLWVSSLLCNGGQQIQAVTAAWVLVQLGAAPQQIALVQVASQLPLMLFALPAGALADTYDRRKVAIFALLLALAGVIAQALLAHAPGGVNATWVLACCAVVGTGMAFYIPAWQSSIAELVGHKRLRSGVALNAMANNLARSVGPALGGFAVVAVGAATTFGLNVLLYIPILVALLFWRRPHEVQKLPPENLRRAVVSGLRYAGLSPFVRRVLLRSTVSAFGTAGIYALLPLVSRDILAGDARTYGLMLGAFGLGAVAAALFASVLRARFTPEHGVRLYSCAQGVASLVLAFSPFGLLSSVALFVIGACWVTNNATYNVSVQMSAPRWVSGRLLAIFFASVAGGLAIGSWCWGHLAGAIGVAQAMQIVGLLMLFSPLLGLFMRLAPYDERGALSVPSATSPEVRIDINGRSGPIAIEITYQIREEQVPEFYELMQQIRRMRERNGAYGASLARDIADPEAWIERLHYPTWHDYVRARDRPTVTERQLQTQANALHQGPGPVRIRRLLERPSGSIASKEAAAERGEDSEYPAAEGPPG